MMEIFNKFIYEFQLFFYEPTILFFLIFSILIFIKERLLMDNFKFILLITFLILPFIFLILPKYFSDNFSLDGWFSFFGSYLAVLGTFGALFWQINLKKNEKNEKIKMYISYIIMQNKENFDKNFKNLHIYLYEIPSIYTEDNYEIKKYSFNFPNFNKNFIENNFEYILTLKKGNDIIKLYNILTKMNFLILNFIEKLEIEKELLLNYDESKENSFYKEYENILDSPYSDDVINYTIKNFHRKAEDKIKYYAFYFIGFNWFKSEMSTLIIRNYKKNKIYENILKQIEDIPQLKNYSEKNNYFHDIHTLTSDYINSLNMKEEDIFLKTLYFDISFRKYQEKIVHLFSCLVGEVPQYFICSPFYKKIIKTQKELKYCDFWIKEFIEIFIEYHKLLDRFNS